MSADYATAWWPRLVDLDSGEVETLIDARRLRFAADTTGPIHIHRSITDTSAAARRCVSPYEGVES